MNYVKYANDRTAATITTHHLIINRNAYLVGGIKPHYYCLPVAKRERHRLALRAAATGGSGKYFLGTDSAPHPDGAKETACGCAGIYTSINTLSCLTHVFEQDEALDKLEDLRRSMGQPFMVCLPTKSAFACSRATSRLRFPPSLLFKMIT